MTQTKLVLLLACVSLAGACNYSSGVKPFGLDCNSDMEGQCTVRDAGVDADANDSGTVLDDGGILVDANDGGTPIDDGGILVDANDGGTPIDDGGIGEDASDGGTPIDDGGILVDAGSSGCTFSRAGTGCEPGAICDLNTGRCVAVEVPPSNFAAQYVGEASSYNNARYTLNSSSEIICEASALQFVATQSQAEWFRAGYCQHNLEYLNNSTETAPALIVRMPNLLASVSAAPSGWMRAPISVANAAVACPNADEASAVVFARTANGWVTLEGGSVDIRRLGADSYQAVVYGYAWDTDHTAYFMVTLNLGNAVYWC